MRVGDRELDFLQQYRRSEAISLAEHISMTFMIISLNMSDKTSIKAGLWHDTMHISLARRLMIVPMPTSLSIQTNAADERTNAADREELEREGRR